MSIRLLRLAKSSDDQNVNEEYEIEPPFVLGRGSVLKCGEKKVSRKQAILDWDEKGVVITSTHICSTYVCIDGKESTLMQGKSATLLDGDSFGLLPESFWFKIALPSFHKKDEDSPPQEMDNSKPNSASPDKSNEEVKEVPTTTFDEGKDDANLEETNKVKEIDNTTTHDEDSPSLDSKGAIDKEAQNGTKELENSPHRKNMDSHLTVTNNVQIETTNKLYVSPRKRDIPSWLDKDLTPQELNSKEKETLKESKQTSHGKKLKKASPVKRDRHYLSDDSDTAQTKVPKVKKQSSPKKNTKAKQYHAMSLEMDEPSGIPTNSATAHCLSDEEEHKDPPNSKSDKDSVPSARSNDLPASSPSSSNQKMDDSSNKKELPASSKISLNPELKANQKSKRTSCPYGSGCFRRNPQHKKDTAHPGDSDYASVDEEETSDNDDRPECEYGTMCYRKNPQHRAAYKHTRKPQPPRRTKKKGKKSADEDDSEDDYDYDDPFLNDNSSDDYNPTDSGSDTPWSGGEEEQDTKRMLKEAKKFVKKKG